MKKVWPCRKGSVFIKTWLFSKKPKGSTSPTKKRTKKGKIGALPLFPGRKSAQLKERAVGKKGTRFGRVKDGMTPREEEKGA